MESIRSLTTKWGFEVDHAPLDRIEGQLEKINNRLEFLAAAEVVKGIYELTEKFAHFAEELHVAATSAGITVEEFQKLTFAAGQSAVSQEELSSSMAKVSRTLYNAKNGSAEAANSFAKLGITPTQLASFKTGEDAMLGIADAIKNSSAPAFEKQALLMQVAGRGSSNMIEFLSKGSAGIKGMGAEAEKLGIVLSHNQVEALVKVEHALMEVWGIFKSLGATIASYLAPSLEYAIKDFIKFYEVNRKVIDSNLREWIYDITYALGFVWGIVKFVTGGFFEFAKSHETLVRRGGELVGVLFLIAGAVLAVQKVMSFLKGTVDILKTAWEALEAVFTFFTEGVLGPIILAVGGLILAIQGIWAVAHGKPAWINQFIDFLGIGQNVQDVFFAIFDIIQDIVNLDFSKLLKDAVGDAKDLAGFLERVGGNVVHFFTGDDGKNAANASNAVQNVANAAAIGSGGIPQSIAGQPAQSSNQEYTVNAPVTINVPPGTDAKTVGDKVKQGITDHLDGVQRRLQQSLNPSQAY